VGRCADVDQPIMAFPAHWAPNDLLFYTGTMFPERYRKGAFVAFHGSWNRAPLEQRGYFVAFIPFNGDTPSGEWEVFAEGFAGGETVESPRDAAYRPMGLAQGPDGSLYIADSQKGRIWRIVHNSAVAASVPQGAIRMVTKK
jgi:glucose/arabinose dehydrogenase